MPAHGADPAASRGPCRRAQPALLHLFRSRIIMHFARGETVRFMPRSRDIAPMYAIICSIAFGLRDVPALGEFYYIIAPAFRGVVSADRLSRKTASLTRMLQTFVRRSEFEAES
jgi:hypothetical protein